MSLPSLPPPRHQRAARRATRDRDARRAARAERRATINARAEILASRQEADGGANHWSLHVAVGLVLTGWLVGCWWLFEEQERFARHLDFAAPQAFPIIVDGVAFVGALLAYGISMSGRTAGGSRMFSTVTISLSAAANGVGAWHRSHDVTAVVVAALVPLMLMWAFHLVLAELRRRVLIRRGKPAQKAPPGLQLIRVLFAGWWALVEYRAIGLAVTDPLPKLGQPDGGTISAPVSRHDESISAPTETISAPRRETDAPADAPRLPNGAPDTAEHPAGPSYGALETDGGALIHSDGANIGANFRAEIDDQRADPRGAKTISAPRSTPARADEQPDEIDITSDQPARPDANGGALIDDGLEPSPPYATKKAHLKALLEELGDDPRTNHELANVLAPQIRLDKGTARRYLGEWRENPDDQRAEINDQRAAARTFAPISAPTADTSPASKNGARP